MAKSLKFMAKPDFVKPDPEIKARLDELLKPYGLTVKELSAKTGIPIGTINNITTKDRDGAVRAEYLTAIWRAFPELDMKYILTGERDLIKLEAKGVIKQSLDQIDQMLNRL